MDGTATLSFQSMLSIAVGPTQTTKLVTEQWPTTRFLFGASAAGGHGGGDSTFIEPNPNPLFDDKKRAHCGETRGAEGPEDDEDLCRLEEWGPAQGQQRSADEAENLRINGDGGNGREVLVPAPGMGRCCK